MSRIVARSRAVIYVQSHKTAIALGAARGAAILAAAERGLPIFEYAPKRIKQATVGRGGADKSQVAFMVRALLGLTETPGPDAADALAIGADAFAGAGSGAARIRRGAADMSWRLAARAGSDASVMATRSRFQEELVARKRADDSLGDELLLLEHEPVYTIGRTPDQSSLRDASHLPHPLFRSTAAARRPIMDRDSWSGIRSSICGVMRRICIAICAGSRRRADRAARGLRSSRADALRSDRRLGGAIAKSRRSAWACDNGSRCTALRSNVCGDLSRLRSHRALRNRQRHDDFD